MFKLIEDIIYKLPIFERGNINYYKLIDLLNSLVKIEADDIEISTCSLTPFYLDINGTYEIYHQALELNLVNEAMFEKYIYMLFKKYSNEIDSYYLKLHKTCPHCWIKKKPYNCGYKECPGYRLHILELKVARQSSS